MTELGSASPGPGSPPRRGADPPAPGPASPPPPAPGAPLPPPGSRWFDTHCHVQDEGEVEALLAGAAAAGVGVLVCIGTDVESSRRAVALAASHREPAGGVQVWATVGLHPHDAARTGAEGVDGVAALLGTVVAGEGGGSGRVVAVGECGLDYHYDRSPRPEQRDAFAAQVALAHAHDLALVIHTREAWDDTFAVLASEGVPERTVFHCFTGGPDEARRCLDLGAWLSFSGIVSFKGAGEVRAAAALCPGDRLLVETDAPFLAPVPHRGQPNVPAFVASVGAAVAAARGVAVEEVAAGSWEAAEAAFGLVGVVESGPATVLPPVP
ncbi:MAG: TatD family hydrolase [Acidimicrobiales bacterium]